MRTKKKYEEKAEVAEKLVEHDLSNGRQVQKRLRSKLDSLGLSPESIVRELQLVKE